MVIPFATQQAIRALGLQDLRAALRFMQALTSDTPGGLGLSRREIGRRLGIAESTLRGVERAGSSPRQATQDRINTRIAESDIFVSRRESARTRIDTFLDPDTPMEYYRPLVPPGSQAFRVVVKNAEGSPYPWSTLTPRSATSFDVRDEITRLRGEGYTVGRVIWDRGN